jgi:hypothetical protein
LPTKPVFRKFLGKKIFIKPVFIYFFLIVHRDIFLFILIHIYDERNASTFFKKCLMLLLELLYDHRILHDLLEILF